jgi:hypothetical protein
MEIDDFASRKLHDDEHIQDAKSYGLLHEEIAAPNSLGLVLQEIPPGLGVRGPGTPLDHVSPDGGTGVVNAEFYFEFQGNAILAILRMITVFLILLGVATLWIGYELEWKGLRWLVAFAANLAVFSLTFGALAGHPRETPAAAPLVQLLMLGLYLASVAARTLVRACNVTPFEVFQVVAAFVLGFGGAIYTTRATGIGSNVLGIAAVLLGIACYGVAFSFMDRQEGRGRNFHFYTSLALLFSLTGTKGDDRESGLWERSPVLGGWEGECKQAMRHQYFRRLHRQMAPGQSDRNCHDRLERLTTAGQSLCATSGTWRARPQPSI